MVVNSRKVRVNGNSYVRILKPGKNGAVTCIILKRSFILVIVFREEMNAVLFVLISNDLTALVFVSRNQRSVAVLNPRSTQ